MLFCPLNASPVRPLKHDNVVSCGKTSIRIPVASKGFTKMRVDTRGASSADYLRVATAALKCVDLGEGLCYIAVLKHLYGCRNVY